MSTRALMAWATILITSSGCGNEPPAPAKKIPPTPRADDFQGTAAPAATNDNSPSPSGQR